MTATLSARRAGPTGGKKVRDVRRTSRILAAVVLLVPDWPGRSAGSSRATTVTPAGPWIWSPPTRAVSPRSRCSLC